MSPSGWDRQTVKLPAAFILFLYLLLSCTSGIAQETDAYCTEVSILTCAPGNRFETAFGHSAIRVKDPAAGTDLVWNFGSFNPSESWFTVKMLFGRGNYYLTVKPFEQFVKPYVRQGQSVFEQTLSLTPDETRRLVYLLERTLESGKGAYRYDGQTANCTTKIRDLLAEALQTKRMVCRYPDSRSYRTILTDGLESSRWVQMFLNVTTGLPFDRRPEGPARLFLPAELSGNLPGLLFDGRKLVSTEAFLFPSGTRLQAPSFPGPAGFLLVLLALTVGLSLFLPKESIWSRLCDGILFVLAGSAGMFLLLLILFSEYEATGMNYNLLWLNPLYFLLIFGRMRKRIRWISLVLLSGCLGYTLMALLLQDRFQIPVFLLITILAIRLIYPLRCRVTISQDQS